MFKVFQCQLSDERVEQVNMSGWDGVEWGKTYMAITFANENADVCQGIDFGLYEHTMNIDSTDLDECFDLGNGVGDMSKVEELVRHKSVSVGDVLVYCDNVAYIVDPFGFKTLKQYELEEFLNMG